MIKKRLLTMAILCAFTTSCISTSAFASTSGTISINKNSTSIKQEIKTYSQYRDTLTNYVSVQADGTFALNAPSNVKNTIPSSILKSIEDGMTATNSLIKSGELKANPNTKKAIKNSSKIVIDSVSGEDKVEFNWDHSEMDIYLNSKNAARFAAKLGNEAIAVGVLTSIFGSTLAGVLVGAAVGVNANEVSDANAEGNGVILSYIMVDGGYELLMISPQ